MIEGLPPQITVLQLGFNIDGIVAKRCQRSLDIWFCQSVQAPDFGFAQFTILAEAINSKPGHDIVIQSSFDAIDRDCQSRLSLGQAGSESDQQEQNGKK